MALMTVTSATSATEPPAASQPAGTVVIADFNCAVRAAGGGLFQVLGGRPDVVLDRLGALGEPAAGAWRIEALAGAPAAGVGGIVPLYDDTPPATARPLDIAATPFLELRLVGELRGRKLQIEVSPYSVEPERAGVVIATVAAADLDAKQWRTIVAPAAAEGARLVKAAAVRLLLIGEGPAWIGVDWIRFCDSAQPAPWNPPVPPAPVPIRQAMWVWNTDEVCGNPAEIEALLAFAQRYKLTDLYCQVLYEYEDGAARLRQAEGQRALLSAAHRQKIKVHALDGSAQFVLVENHPRMFALVEALDRFNREGPTDSRFDALHLDNEPYLVPKWKNDATRQGVIDGYLKLNQELRQRANAAGMEYGVDIPFWFDQREKPGVPKFAVQTPEGQLSLLEALFRCVQNVGIMSYRERVTGKNGVPAVCRTEFELAQKYGVDVFASIEVGTGPRVEPGITFGVYPFQYFQEQLATLQAALGVEQGCRGLAIHHYGELRAWEARQ